MKNMVKMIGIIALVAVIGFSMTACGGKDDDDDGQPKVANYPTITLGKNVPGAGQVSTYMTSGRQIKLSDFTTIKPTQQGDELYFKVSGNADAALNNFKIIIFQMQGDDWDTHNWLGTSDDDVTLSTSFKDSIIKTTIWSDTPPKGDFYVEIQTAIPATNPSMVTIKNFSITLVVPKNLRITVPKTIYEQSEQGGYWFGVYPAGTTFQQALDTSRPIAFCGTYYIGGLSTDELGSNILVTSPLYVTNTNELWTGSGTFDIYAFFDESDSKTYFYKVSSVSITTATTNITITDANKVP